MSQSSGGENSGFGDDELIDDHFAEKLVKGGVDRANVDKVTKILAEIGVATIGTLRLFAGAAGQLEEVVYQALHDPADKLGALKAKGFIANLRVRLPTPIPPPQSLHDCTCKQTLGTRTTNAVQHQTCFPLQITLVAL